MGADTKRGKTFDAKSFVGQEKPSLESIRSSGNQSEHYKNQKQVVEEHDFAIISQCYIDRLVFDDNIQKQPPISVNLCSGDDFKLNRSLLVTLIYDLVSLILVNFS